MKTVIVYLTPELVQMITYSNLEKPDVMQFP